jgi:hypothetical protein
MGKPKVPPTSHPGLPIDIAAIRAALKAFYELKFEGQKLGGFKHGIYAFFDYDGEPIYVGQTEESIRSRIGRHLTNQRTDAVAMNVLDPFEVAEIEVWPLRIDELGKGERKEILDAAEFAVYHKLLNASTFRAVLNEAEPSGTPGMKLPASIRRSIIPADLYPARKHPDVRIARRAQTIANLARVISERHASYGLRKTLVTQAQRLEKLAAERLSHFSAGESLTQEAVD